MRWWIIVGIVATLGVGVHYATDSNARFCVTHSCIGSFGSGHGSIVQCSDGTWSHSGGIQGACSWHGGVRIASSYSSSTSVSDGFGSAYSGGTPTSATTESSAAPPVRAGPTRQQRAAAARAAAARRAAAERARAAAAARRAAAARAAATHRAQAARDALYAITNELGRVNDRLVRAKGVGTAADAAEVDRIETKLTDWQVDHALAAPIGTTTPLQRLAEAAFSLASTLGLVIQDNGGGLWNSEWSNAVDKFNAAIQAAPD